MVEMGPPEGKGVTVGGVFLLTTIMAAMSGLGAIPFFFVGRLSPRIASLGNAVACGVMLAASFDMIHEGGPYGGFYVVCGVCAGAVFISVMQGWLHGAEDVKFEMLRGADARKTLLMVGIMAAHALGEGSGVGVSFSGAKGWAQGQLITLAIGVHNIPEGMAVATVLAARGVSPKKCAAWAILTSMPQPLVAVPAFVFVETFQALLPFAMGFAAGCMVWITLAELLPDALDHAAGGEVATWATVAAAALEGFRMYTSYLENDDGSFDSPFKPAAPARVPDVRAGLDPIPSTTGDDATFDGAGAGASRVRTRFRPFPRARRTTRPSIRCRAPCPSTPSSVRTPTRSSPRRWRAWRFRWRVSSPRFFSRNCSARTFSPPGAVGGTAKGTGPLGSGTGCWTAAWIRPRCWTSRSSWRWRRGRAR